MEFWKDIPIARIDLDFFCVRLYLMKSMAAHSGLLQRSRMISFSSSSEALDRLAPTLDNRPGYFCIGHKAFEPVRDARN